MSQKYQTLLATGSTIVLYFLFGYGLDRTDFSVLFATYTILFVPFFYVLKKEKMNLSFLMGTAILFRLIFLFAIPNLSQDFYRFIWDGRMILEGINPFISIPETFVEKGNIPISQGTELYRGMGQLSGSHCTNYPPVNQFNFLIAAVFSNTSIVGAVIVMRLQIILADIGIIYFGKKILKQLNLPHHLIFLYALNPLIIIELTGNLHFESVMLVFLVWSLHLLLKGRWIWSAIILGLSVSVKLIPLLFLPLFFQWFTSRISLPSQTNVSIKTQVQKTSFSWVGLSKLVLFGMIVVFVNIILFIPFVSTDLVNSYTGTIGLWFQNFEFNASLYYIARAIGYTFRGWNEIAVIGKIMPALTSVFLIIITFFRKNRSPKQLISALLLGLTCYYVTTTTVHPWYLAPLVLLSVFTTYRYPLVWSVVIVLSYHAYGNELWRENLWLVGLEYLFVYGMLIWEIIQIRLRSSSRTSKLK